MSAVNGSTLTTTSAASSPSAVTSNLAVPVLSLTDCTRKAPRPPSNARSFSEISVASIPSSGLTMATLIVLSAKGTLFPSASTAVTETLVISVPSAVKVL